MNEENTKFLYENYPKLYRQHNLPMSETCMCWDFACGDGWFDIINELSEFIEAENNKREEYFCEAIQVKEKYGTLRFYIRSYSDKVDKKVTEIEDRSEYTCEECGKEEKPSTLKKQGYWVYNMCNDCWKKFQEGEIE